ncbi:hypothetical protein X474_15590 [Dethiosulfatarculus sandiegensis]|uniref:Uncharacterized protein n=1 Tax=Dethiosulfatarculus sandiegensis TaxID=1429043 RepID=A0A0D2HRG8_9BACT|nr:hypothetical protein X474_15590 [Dethiosulfatarculus sandiegensis]
MGQKMTAPIQASWEGCILWLLSLDAMSPYNVKGFLGLSNGNQQHSKASEFCRLGDKGEFSI